MPKLILCRHGQSEWNAKIYLQVGPMSNYQNKELKRRNQQVKIYDNQIEIDIAFTSLLTRALETTQYILAGSDQQWIPVYKSWRLNERHYGGLQGLNKDDAKKWGKIRCINGDAHMMYVRLESEEQREAYLKIVVINILITV